MDVPEARRRSAALRTTLSSTAGASPFRFSKASAPATWRTREERRTQGPGSCRYQGDGRQPMRENRVRQGDVATLKKHEPLCNSRHNVEREDLLTCLDGCVIDTPPVCALIPSYTRRGLSRPRVTCIGVHVGHEARKTYQFGNRTTYQVGHRTTHQVGHSCSLRLVCHMSRRRR